METINLTEQNIIEALINCCSRGIVNNYKNDLLNALINNKYKFDERHDIRYLINNDEFVVSFDFTLAYVDRTNLNFALRAEASIHHLSKYNKVLCYFEFDL